MTIQTSTAKGDGRLLDFLRDDQISTVYDREDNLLGRGKVHDFPGLVNWVGRRHILLEGGCLERYPTSICVVHGVDVDIGGASYRSYLCPYRERGSP